MQIAISIDPNLPRWLKRVAMYAGVPAVLVVAGAVYAGVPVQTFLDGEPLSSKKMNDNFTALSTAISAASPPGSIIAYGGIIPPTGWMVCNGDRG